MQKRAIAPMELVIGLVILIVLAVLLITVLGQKTQTFVKGTTCESQGGTCVASRDSCATAPMNLECSDPAKPVCCSKG